MTSVSPPTLPLADGAMSIGSFTDPVVVDPDPPLLAALAAAYRDAAPAAVAPDLDALRTAAQDDDDPLSQATDLPTLTVLARGSVVDALADRFHPASRLAALAETSVWDLRTLAEAQPNVVLAGQSDGCVLVAAAEGRDGDGERGPWCRICGDATLRSRYSGLVADAEAIQIRTPSRHRLYGALRDRCGSTVADEAVGLLDAGADWDSAEALDRGEARVRTYVAGARRGALDRALRRACEDAGLGSSATFTRIKRDLLDADLLETESVSQPVGRPRQRLVARGALADASSSSATLAALRKRDL
ncbi:transcriptional regulator TbsP domain-containing protein [Halorubrum sp. N11]|uniref:transcriptional regulator TbsP domain-containing protein n=1 Tax=Halorubrum sp. N11 TaxID=3402276 RepID=UPI003EC11E35